MLFVSPHVRPPHPIFSPHDATAAAQLMAPVWCGLVWSGLVCAGAGEDAGGGVQLFPPAWSQGAVQHRGMTTPRYGERARRTLYPAAAVAAAATAASTMPPRAHRGR